MYFMYYVFVQSCAFGSCDFLKTQIWQKYEKKIFTVFTDQLDGVVCNTLKKVGTEACLSLCYITFCF